MPVQAIPLALIASLYPLGLAAILLLAEAARPRPKVGVFLIGALVTHPDRRHCVVVSPCTARGRPEQPAVEALGALAIGWCSWRRFPSRPGGFEQRLFLVSRPPAGAGSRDFRSVLGSTCRRRSPVGAQVVVPPRWRRRWVVIVVALVLIRSRCRAVVLWRRLTVPRLRAVNSWLTGMGARCWWRWWLIGWESSMACRLL